MISRQLHTFECNSETSGILVQGGGTPTHFVLPAATAVKMKVKSQAKKSGKSKVQAVLIKVQ